MHPDVAAQGGSEEERARAEEAIRELNEANEIVRKLL